MINLYKLHVYMYITCTVHVLTVFFLLVRIILNQVVKGLIYLHSFNIVHRDLSLSNILLTSSMDAVSYCVHLCVSIFCTYIRHLHVLYMFYFSFVAMIFVCFFCASLFCSKISSIPIDNSKLYMYMYR